MQVDEPRPLLLEPLREHAEVLGWDFTPDLGEPRRRLDRVPIHWYAIVFVATLGSVNRWRCYSHITPATLKVPREPVHIGLGPSYRIRVVPAGQEQNPAPVRALQR
jgi:hypothetical protein